MIVLGLTGSIGMGKSTTAALFAEAGAPVWEADAVVHWLYGPGGAAAEVVEAAFPGVLQHGALDRAALSARVANDGAALAKLEGLVHPLVAKDREEFLTRAKADGAPVAVVDIPLLFETGADRFVDAVAVVTAPAHVQHQRVMARPGMDAAKFAALLERQTPDALKRERADFIIDTSKGLDHARDEVGRVLEALRRPDWRPGLDEGCEPSQ